VEIDYLEQNKQNQEEKKLDKKEERKSQVTKLSEYAQIYAVVSQGFLMMICVAGAGFLIGHYAIGQDTWAAILAVIGGLIGLGIFISLLFKLKIGGDKNGR
jgi:urea transporter